MKQLTIGKNQPSIRVFSDEQVREIHITSLTILEDVGIDLREQEALDLLVSRGASGSSSGRLHIPQRLVQEALSTVPRYILLHTRTRELTMPLHAGRIYFGTGSDTIYTRDVETGERRLPTRQDIRRIATLVDALPNLSFVMSMGTVWDAPSADNYIHTFIEMLRGSLKPIVFTAKDRRDIEHIWRIAITVSGGERELREKPFLLHYSEPISPLLFTDESVQKLLFCAEKNIPVTYCPSPNMGAGGPVTMAGALAQANAETLGGMVIAQALKNPGCPYLYGANVAVFDMRTSVISWRGSAEKSILLSATDGSSLLPLYIELSMPAQPTSFLCSPQCRLQVHRQEARPHPHLRSALSRISDAIQSIMFFPVPERAFDPVPLFLLRFKPGVVFWISLDFRPNGINAVRTPRFP